ncbi:MAG: signal peptide peptidase SppA [Proteobacteria bacterium]|nr:signal peptide peptidase SppA [Pseudomonadota bacterium]
MGSRSVWQRFGRLGLLCAIALGTSGCITVDLFGGRDAPLQEAIVAGKRGPKVAVIDVSGVLRVSDAEGGWLQRGRAGTLAHVREQLDLAAKDDQVKALLIRVDSPGGSAVASDLVYEDILRVKRERGLPVAAQFVGVATSGGYYAAMAADVVVAQRNAVTGSIGVLFQGVSLQGLMDKLGVEDQTLVSGPFKDAGSPLRRMKAAERQHLQTVLDDLHDRFREVVVAGRPQLGAEQVAGLADGRIFSAPQALAAGLVDAIGSPEDSVERLRAILGVPEVRVVRYHARGETPHNLYARALSPPDLRAELLRWLPVLPSPGFHYLWWPAGH